MDAQRRDRLNQLMAEISAGDTSKVFRLGDEFHDEIAGAVRHHLRAFGVPLDHDTIEELVIDFCLLMPTVGKGWSPDGGALPWRWAQARLRQLVAQHLGVFAAELDADIVDDASGGDDPDGRSDWEILGDLATRLPQAALLIEAAEVLGRERIELLIAHHVQRIGGDRAPAHTLAERTGARPATVRKRVQRARQALLRLIEDDPGFGGLSGLPLAS